MMNLEQIRAALQDRHPMEVAERAGVHHNTVRMIRDNPNANPKWRVLESISKVLTETRP